MTNTADDLNDKELIRLAEAERDAGVPDVQAAQAAAAAKARLDGAGGEAESEAHPS